MKVKGTFGNWLRERRKALDLTQAELADQVGCAAITIRKIERDSARPSKQISERLADVLAISLEERAEFVAFARGTGASVPVALDESVPYPHNLPLRLTPFIGREDELAQIAERLADRACRLLTLVGAGGIGKTRLALEVAAQQLSNFADGVYFVSLTGVGAPHLVAPAIASALEVSFYGPEDPDVQLVHSLRSKALLLVLDNFEHLLGATGLLTDILATGPAVKILTTSRERLNLQEEWVITLEGLSFPSALDRTRRSTSLQNDAIGVGTPFLASEFDKYSAVQLFVQRAQQIQANFLLEQNAESVLTICRCVEGMPLGLELAASWLRGMSCSQIGARMERSLDFLVTTVRNVPERHSSLRAVFEQSWRLLSDTELRVLAALSVFRGGFDLEAAEQVAEASPAVMVGLADKSLIRLNSSDRYDLQELLRQFAADKLAETGESAAVSRRHLDYFLKLAERMEAHIYGPLHELWFDRMEIELDNLSAAVAWSLNDNKIETGLRLVGALEFFWKDRVHYHEGRTWTEKLLVQANNDVPAAVRAKALRLAAEMAIGTGDKERARVCVEEGLRQAQASGDKASIAWAVGSLGQYMYVDYDTRRAWFEQALALFREIGDEFAIGHMLRRLSTILLYQANYERARLLDEEALALARAAQDTNAIAWSLAALASAIWGQSRDPVQTLPLREESLSLAREIRSMVLIANLLCGMGWIARDLGDYRLAQSRFTESLVTFRAMGSYRLYAAIAVGGFGELAEVQGRPERAARLFGAASALTGSGKDTPGSLSSYTDIERDILTLRVQLGEAAFATLWAEGQAMTLDQAIAYALEPAEWRDAASL
ncbi:MAG: ATP-binding protein [Aggregatilineales bacterium]